MNLRAHLIPRRRCRALAAAALALLALAPASMVLPGCKSNEKPPEITRPEDVPNPLPRYLQGTVMYVASLRGYTQRLVEGYGLVVGLDGTGSNDTPIPIRAALERQGARLLSSSEIGNRQPLTMQRLLSDQNTAAVLVQAVVPPGAVKGTKFDLLVSAVTGSSTTSLEGGRLWTTELRQGTADVDIGGTSPVAFGSGDLFINPFETNYRGMRTSLSDRWDKSTKERDESAEQPSESPAGDAQAQVDPDTGFAPIEGLTRNRRVARILGGGTVVQNLPLSLVLRNSGFSRARAIIDAVNTRFPQEPGQERLTATPVTGRSSEEIAITVPPSWSDRTETFVEILLHTQIYPGGVELRSSQLARWVVENPIDAPDVTWCWVALGDLAIEGFAPLYDHPDLVPRLAALHAGAQLGDGRVAQPLIDIAMDRSNALRVDAIKRLTEMPRSARINLAMRDLVDDPQLDVRVAAVEALLKNHDPYVRRVASDIDSSFEVYALPASEPLLYVTIQGTPKIIVFGENGTLPCPMTGSTLDDRLLLNWTDNTHALKVRYRPKGTLSGIVYEPQATLVGFVRFLGTHPSPHSPTASLGLTYGEVLRILYEMQLQNMLGSTMVCEHDRITASIIESQRHVTPDERPETHQTKGNWNPLDPDENAAKQPESKTDSVGMDDQGVRVRK